MTEHQRPERKGISRGAFLRLGAGAAASCLLPRAAAPASERPVARRAIPKSGERLAVVGLGTARTFDVQGTPEDMAPRKEVLRRLIEAGGKVIDSAPTYGEAERIAGTLLDELGMRNAAFIATKISTRGGRDAGIVQMQDSMRLFHTAKIDLMQVHNLMDTATHLHSIRQWRDAGRIRYVGVTTSFLGAYDELERVMRTEPLDFVQLKYSLKTRDAEARLLPLAADRGIAVLVNRPYDLGGVFRAVRGRTLPPWAAEFDAASWGQFFLKYILAHPAVTCAIPGTRKPQHMIDNLDAGRGALPDAAQRRRMVAFWQSL